MKGRLEHNLKIESTIDDILKEMPKFVKDYYYSFKQGRQPRACLNYLIILRRYFIFVANETKEEFMYEKFPRGVAINDINSIQIISRYMDSINVVESNGEIRESSIGYRQATYSAINSLYMYLEDNGYIEKNPMKSIKRAKGKDNVKRKFLKEEDLKKILKAIDDGVGTETMKKHQNIWKTRNKAIMMLFMETGIRASALTEINVEDLDLNHNSLTVINKGHKPFVYKIDDSLKTVIIEWLNDREKILDGDKRDALFISSRKNRISTSTLGELVKMYSNYALGYGISPHKFRAAFANMILRNSNGNIYLAQRMLDHSSPETTKIYLDDISEEDKSKVADMISTLVF